MASVPEPSATAVSWPVTGSVGGGAVLVVVVGLGQFHPPYPSGLHAGPVYPSRSIGGPGVAVGAGKVVVIPRVTAEAGRAVRPVWVVDGWTVL